MSSFLAPTSTKQEKPILELHVFTSGSPIVRLEKWVKHMIYYEKPQNSININQHPLIYYESQTTKEK